MSHEPLRQPDADPQGPTPEPASPPPLAEPNTARADFGLRAQAWLRDARGLSFGRIERSPSPVLVGGGACRAWRYARARFAWWGYLGACSLMFSAIAAAVAMRRLDAATYLAVTTFAWTGVAVAALAWSMAWQTGRRDRYEIAVAWDAGQRPLTAAERASVVAGLRARWPDARECWLLTLRTLGLPENDAGLVVIPVREPDLPRLSAGAAALLAPNGAARVGPDG